ncbi:NAD(P)-binding domain-containing protein [Gammaproteobacteria bacterium]|nr:NAD(P)-binding domain-containing protein [Gammaproteobacteria bacterium]
MLNKEDYKICIVGLGYVGHPLAARFAMKGFNIIGFDIKEERVNQLIEQIDVNEGIDNDSLNHLSKNSLLTSNIYQLY